MQRPDMIFMGIRTYFWWLDCRSLSDGVLVLVLEGCKSQVLLGASRRVRLTFQMGKVKPD